MADIISFTINGTKYEIDPSNTTLGPTTRLVSFIRSNANLTGTKTMCMEGGCGACLVEAISVDPVSGQTVTRSVNSCLVPVLSCNGWIINTIESLGNRREGYNAIQQRLVGFGGTQCGYCSSGMVMNMFSLQQARGDTLTMQQIEDNYDGNLCRCTGYRPILDAMKSFAIDAPEELKAKARDIEELCKTSCPLKPEVGCCGGQESCGEKRETINKGCSVGASSGGGCCQGNQKPTGCCQDKSAVPSVIPSVDAVFPGGIQWIKATDLASAFAAVKSFVDGGLRYRVVGGNTGIGVFKNEGSYGAYLDVNDVTEMRATTVTTTAVTFGGTNTLSFLIDFFQTNASRTGFEYLAGMSQHLRRVANTSVRNLATLSGNLMLKHDHHEFPSDIFVLLETVGARLNIGTSATAIQAYSPLEFLDIDMSGRLIVSVSLSQKIGYSFRSYKITKRHQNAHAYVNAGFLFRLDDTNNYRVLEKPTIVFGGINPTFSHAVATENFLTGTELGSINTLRAAVAFLEDEIQPDYIPPDAPAEYRKKLAVNLFYKTVLGLLGSSVSNRNETGGQDLPHLLTKGEQIYDADTGDTPLYKPVHKLEATAQVAGEAQYINDIPAVPGELFAAFVQSTEGNAILASIDTSAAIAIPGVVAVLTAADIPGKNDNMGLAGAEPEPIFVEVGSRVQFHGQAIALVVANNRGTSSRALASIKVTYSDVQKPVVRIEDAIEKSKKEGKLKTIVSTSPKKAAPNAVTKRVSSSFRTGGQAHFQMEQMITIARPTELGLDVFASTQWTDHVQDVIAAALNIPNNKLSIQVRRLGGAYGCKITRGAQTAVACSLAAFVTNKPVRLTLDLETNMSIVGKRFPLLVSYDVGVNDNGKIEELNFNVTCDTGAYSNESVEYAVVLMFQNCYQAIGWTYNRSAVTTNTPPNTWARAPGSIKGVAIIETIMNHIAFETGLDPVEVRRVNLIQEGDTIVEPNPNPTFKGPNLIPELLVDVESSYQYSVRKAAVEEFNRNNRWRKRGIALSTMRYPQAYGVRYGAYIAIYHEDGTVAVSHAGIEMGQGINTKVAQVVAHILQIPLDKIVIKPSDNFIGANSDTTGGALTSELVSYAALICAQTLKDRIDEVRKEHKIDATDWELAVQTAHLNNVDLRATFMHTPKDPPEPYDIWGLNAVEAEIDCLTGEFKVIRSDLIADVGKSLSPEVDVGQVEGAYIMGMGFWTKERLIYDENNGELLTNNTWQYKIPFAKCLPEDFRIKFISDRPNPLGVLSSKSSGEAPICLTITVVEAIRNAILSARQESGNNEWVTIDLPLSPDEVVRHCLTNSSQFTY